MSNETFCIVTTDKRGVFAGWVDDAHIGRATLTIREARMCVYWSKDVRGVIGLAATGPTSGCRVTRSAPEMVLRGVTSVASCSTDALAAWESEPWS